MYRLLEFIEVAGFDTVAKLPLAPPSAIEEAANEEDAANIFPFVAVAVK